MIRTTWENIYRYEKMVPGAKQVFERLDQLLKEPFKEGHYVINGDTAFINAIEIETKEVQKSVMEAHKKYADILVCVSGCENVGWSDLKNIKRIIRTYDDSDDSIIAELPINFTFIPIKRNDVLIFFPEDAHAPGMIDIKKQKVCKLVAKVRIDREM